MVNILQLSLLGESALNLWGVTNGSARTDDLYPHKSTILYYSGVISMEYLVLLDL